MLRWIDSFPEPFLAWLSVVILTSIFLLMGVERSLLGDTGRAASFYLEAGVGACFVGVLTLGNAHQLPRLDTRT